MFVKWENRRKGREEKDKWRSVVAVQSNSGIYYSCMGFVFKLVEEMAILLPSSSSTLAVSCSMISSGCMDPLLATLFGPGEVCDGDDEEAVRDKSDVSISGNHYRETMESKIAVWKLERTYLFEVLAMPARALYQARKAVMRPKTPPAIVRPWLGFPAASGVM
jgi:hypothetical protein